MPLIILITLVVGGGVSVAAQNSLPNEALYFVKTGLNENVRAFVAYSEKLRAEVAADLAIRRLEEMEKLAAKGEVRTEVRTRVQAKFNDHANEFKLRIFRLKEKGDLSAAADIQSNFETSLRAHEQVLASLNVNGGIKGKLTILVDSVHDQLIVISADRRDIEAKLLVSADVERVANEKLVAAEVGLKEIERYLENSNQHISAEARAYAMGKLNIAEASVIQGRAKLEAGSYGEALSFFQGAMRLAQEARLRASVSGALRLSSDFVNTTSTENAPPLIEVGEGSIVSAGVEVELENKKTGGELDVNIKP